MAECGALGCESCLNKTTVWWTVFCEFSSKSLFCQQIHQGKTVATSFFWFFSCDQEKNSRAVGTDALETFYKEIIKFWRASSASIG